MSFTPNDFPPDAKGRFDEFLVEAARSFAIKAHGDQKYGDEPYSVHLEDVLRVLDGKMIFDEAIRAAGYLHDVVEDTEVTLEALESVFPREVTSLVSAVTSEPGKNRKERNAATYPKIRANHKAVILKLADRVANVRRSLRSGSSTLSMYKKEYQGFRDALYYASLETAPFWEELDSILK